MDAQDIMERLYYKRGYAQMTDYDYDGDNHVWVLGVEVYRKLISHLEKNVPNYITRDVVEDKPIYILGIRVEKIDYRHPTRIALYKEV